MKIKNFEELTQVVELFRKNGENLTECVTWLKCFVSDIEFHDGRIRLKVKHYKQVKGTREDNYYSLTVWQNNNTAGHEQARFFKKGDRIKALGNQHQYQYSSGAHGVEIALLWVEKMKEGER